MAARTFKAEALTYGSESFLATISTVWQILFWIMCFWNGGNSVDGKEMKELSILEATIFGNQQF